MKKVILALGVVGVVAGALGVSMILASELGEVVVLTTFDTNQSAVTTRMWIVDHDGFSWLRSGKGSSWLERIEGDPNVDLTRGDTTQRFRASPVRTPIPVAQVNTLMREKYGLSDRWISLFVDRGSSVVIRLVPLDEDNRT
jgi:hypothetical protein